MRRVFVGDIQGCLRQLDGLLAAVGFVPGTDRLFPLGDMVNKGPDSEGVLARLMELDARPVLGNHDLLWLRRGRLVDLEQETWLRSQPIVRILDDLILVHAGLHPMWSESDLPHLEGDQVDYAVTVRYCDASGRRPESDWPPPDEPFRPWHEFYRGAKRVVYGHWARQGLHVGPNTLGLDSGCVYGNPLTAWVAEEDRIYQF